MVPTTKNNFIRYNNAISFTCTLIAKIGLTLQPNARSLLLRIEIMNELSASAKPVIHLGSRENSISLFRDSLELKLLLLVHELCIERGFEGKRQPTNTLITSILCGPILLRVFVLV
jgi:hypothetical protein